MKRKNKILEKKTKKRGLRRLTEKKKKRMAWINYFRKKKEANELSRTKVPIAEPVDADELQAGTTEDNELETSVVCGSETQ